MKKIILFLLKLLEGRDVEMNEVFNIHGIEYRVYKVDDEGFSVVKVENERVAKKHNTI